MSVRVVARIRPLLKSENEIDQIVHTAEGADGKTSIVKIPNPKNAAEEYSFQFGSVYGQESTQQELFDAEVSPTVKHLFQGFDVTLFAYGSTGTGKTHTMKGGKSLADRGMIPRLLSAIYRKSKAIEKSTNGETSVEIVLSYYEIYNDRVYDLFESPDKRTPTGLPIREAEGGKTVVVGLSEVPCTSLKEFEGLYDRANANRSTGATKLNAHSSRSHAILCVKVTMLSPTETRVSTASAIDLAGSEDNRRTGNAKERMTESASINKSLFVLAQCVEAISKKQARIPYRESKMTRILSLGQNNGFTIMILNLAPTRQFHLDTLSSLNFANRTKKIQVREIENEPLYRGPARQPAVAGTTMPRQPLRPLTSHINVNLAANRDREIKDKPPKAFAVYSDHSKPGQPRPSQPGEKPSPLKRAAESQLASSRPAKISRPALGYRPPTHTLTQTRIESIVEAKVSAILSKHQSLAVPQPAPQPEISAQVQARLDSIERRLQGQEGERAEGLSYLFMAKQHEARGEVSSALKMYELARTYFDGNEKLEGKIRRLAAKVAAKREAEQQHQGDSNNSLNNDDNSYHGSDVDSDEDEAPMLRRPRRPNACSKRPRLSSPDPLSSSVSPRTKYLLGVINSRDITQIKALHGLGAKRAEGIVDYLEELGDGVRLHTWRDLSAIRGVGKKTLESMRDGVRTTSLDTYSIERVRSHRQSDVEKEGYAASNRNYDDDSDSDAGTVNNDYDDHRPHKTIRHRAYSAAHSRRRCLTLRFPSLRWLCLGVAASILLFMFYLVRMSQHSAKAVEVAASELAHPAPKPHPWEQFPFLERYYGGVRKLVAVEDNEPEYPGLEDDVSSDATPDDAAEEAHPPPARRAVPSTLEFDPYTKHRAQEYISQYGDKVDCFLDAADKVDVPRVRTYSGIPSGFPDPVMGSGQLLGLRHDICYDRFGRLGPYGLGYSINRGGSGAQQDGEREGADAVWSEIPEVDYRQVKWTEVQERCVARNIHRFKEPPKPRIDRFRAMQVGSVQKRAEDVENVEIVEDVDAEDPQELTRSPAPAVTTPPPKPRTGKDRLPRTAVVIRTWSTYQYTPEDLINLRSIISELNVLSGGEYTVHFLIQAKDENLPIWADDETYERVLRDSLPEEFRGMGVLWNERQMLTMYGGLEETWMRDLPVHGVYRSTFMPLQYFAYQHPEYDFFWNWEMDVRSTHHWYHLFESVGEWAKKQPRKYLWERNSRFYVPAKHGSWEDFSHMVRVQTEQGTNSVNNIWSGLRAGGKEPGAVKQAGDRPVWGPELPLDDEVAFDDDPQPPTSLEKDKYKWGVGEEADLITFNPLFDPDGTTWLLADDTTGYNITQGRPPRRTAIITATRLSRRLLLNMHKETALRKHTMFSEMWPASCALHHGLKAVYAPHAEYIDRKWPIDFLEATFNGGRNGATGGARTSVFGDREHNFRGTTWYYNAGFPEVLWHRWLANTKSQGQEQPPEVVESIETAEVNREKDKEEGQEDESDTSGRPVSNKVYKALKAITEVLTDYKIQISGVDYYPSLLFKRVPNRRNLPDYYQVIKEPTAISTLKGKIQRKTYSGIPEFVRDFALIVYNAQVYNRPNSQPVKDVFMLDAVFRRELQKLVDQGLAKEDEIVYPDLGEIPDATPVPDVVSEQEDEEDHGEADGDGDGEDEDDEDEGDDSDDGRRRRKRGRKSKSDKGKGDDEDEDGRRRRGRPPKVDTPMEARIKAVIKGIRKPKDEQGNFRLRHFERLPDKAEYPHYYQEIKEPIAMDTIKKKAKRKKYRTLDDLIRDFELMFKNAMTYNLDSSEIYKDAEALLQEAKALAEAEKARPDDEFALEDGRIPLPDGIEYKGEIWKVGDWIHVQNANDVTKPIVAQIYRSWKDSEGRMWINACWYYRPEQTVHHYEKHFYPSEVVKTGQYRDHHIEEVIDRCFVMFFTRYSRGRPRNIDPTKEVYVCEARYNEEKHKFNKIKTWASCLPDEVRDKDYAMDLFDVPRKIKKQPSPLKHLLKEDDGKVGASEIPTPQWGNKNAPPIIGGIYKGPRDENSASQVVPVPGSAHVPPSHLARPSPILTPQLPAYQSASVSPAPQFGRQPGYQPAQTAIPPALVASTPAVPSQAIPQQPPQQFPMTPAGAGAAGLILSPAYNHPAPPLPLQMQQPYTRTPGTFPPPPPPPGVAAAAGAAATAAAYRPTPHAAAQHLHPHPHQPYGPPYHHPGQLHEHRTPEAFVLSDTANESIPKHIRDRFPRDDQGRILFFTRPPADTRHIVSGKSDAEHGRPLKHTDAYLAAKADRLKLLAEQQSKKRRANSDRVHFFYHDDGRENDPTAAAALSTREETEWLLSQNRWTGRRKDGRGRQ
ncbi:hypothetical protein DV735_g2756, partial [Chaetothyriales sp. CBS 134920]